jgi:glycosyltransferase involved in cell wall biosynthesis
VIRVAIDATPLIGHRTGVGAFAARAIDGLAGRDEVEITAFAVTWRNRGLLRSMVPPETRGVRAPMPAGPLHAAWARVDGPVIERWTGPVDVVHGTNCIVPPARRAAEVVTIHDLTFVHFPELCDPVSLRFPRLIRRALRRGAFVHADSETVAAEVIDHFGARPERVRVVPLGVEPSSSPGLPPGDPAPSGRRYVLALGTVEPRKDIPSLVRAFDMLAAGHPDVELVIAGAPGWGEVALDTAVRASVHAGRIRRLGWVDDEERLALLRGAAVLAYPSLYEGFGLPPLEAMAAGVPVVATAAGAVPEVVGDAAVLVPIGDEGALAEAIAGVLDEPDLHRRLVVAGTRRAARFTWDRCVAGLVELYEDAAESRGARG